MVQPALLKTATCWSPLALGSLGICHFGYVYGYVELLVEVWSLEVFSGSLKPGLQAANDGLAYVLYGLLKSVSFRETTRQVSALGHKPPVLIPLDSDVKFHLYRRCKCVFIKLPSVSIS
jgi:hypothetical protein